MSRIFITGSVDGLGRAAAQTLLAEGHQVILHARAPGRLEAVRDLLDKGAQAVIGDLSEVQQIRQVAEQVNRIGRPNAVIHNAGMFTGPQVMPVNVMAPYLLTALIERPDRIVYLSSSMHFDGVAELNGVDWLGGAAAPIRTASCSSPRWPPPWRACGPASSAARSIPAGCQPKWAARMRPTIWRWDT